MFKIQDVKNLLFDFAEKEFQVNRNKFDLSISEEKYCEEVEKFLETYYSLFYISLKTGSLMTRSLEDLDAETIEWNTDSTIKRKIFLIRHYRNAKFGSGIEKTDNNELFSCFLGPDSDLIGVNVYTDNFYFGVISNQLKIISHRTLKNDDDINGKLEWEYNKQSVEFAEKITVLDNGELIETLRIEEPELDAWLEDYNS